MSKLCYTFCRICEPACPLVAEVADDGCISKLHPDRAHPVSQGFACAKGLSFLDVHNDPDRPTMPLRRTNPRSEAIGHFEPIAWEDAISDIGTRLRALIDNHGPDSVAFYIGNPGAFNSSVMLPLNKFMKKIGTKRIFNAGVQDCSNKFAATEAVYGSAQTTIPDLYSTDYLLILGANPKVSHWTQLAVHHSLHALQDIIGRGGKVVQVNSRRVESTGNGLGEFVPIKPDTDVYLLAAILHEIHVTVGFDEDAMVRFGKNADGLCAFVARYPADRVEAITGIDAATIRTIAHDFATARSAAAYMSLGVNQGRQGTLAYWLLIMLSFVTGNLGGDGGNYYAKGFYPRPWPVTPEGAFFDTELGKMRLLYGSLPGTVLVDFIESKVNPIRALVVSSGNPLLSIPGEERMRQAFPKLELMVSMDLYRNATGEYADYVLPAPDWLERDDINACANGYQPFPYVQFAGAVVPPRHGRKSESWVLWRLEQAMGYSAASEDEPYNHAHTDRKLSVSGLSIEKLKTMDHQTAVLPQPVRSDFYESAVLTSDHKLDCCPASFAEAIERCERIFLELCEEPAGKLKMINLRTNYMHNTYLANMKSLKRDRHALNPLHIHPEDARSRGLREGDSARIFNGNGSVSTAITLDETLLPGVVALSHGYGHQHAPGMRLAYVAPGVNVNRLCPTGPDSYERLSNQAHMTGIPVEVEKIGG